jgi:ELWxxDGT repeat protein
MKTILSLLIFCICSIATQAQIYTSEMIQNLNLNGGSNPRWLTVWDTTLYFMANDGTNGQKVFSMTPSTLPYLNPQLIGSAVFGDGTVSTNQKMPILNNKIYMPILAPQIGRELYSYNGGGMPSIMADLNPGNGSSNPSHYLTYNNKLYFQANTPNLGSELWVHDPIANTTQNLTDINPGIGHSTIAFTTLFNNKLYFAASSGNDTLATSTGMELYCFDPSTNVTNIVADINPGYLPSNPTALMVHNGKLYFVASEPVYGKELYSYDGSVITRLTDINPGPAQGVYTSDHSFPTYFNGSIYFAANDANNLINLGRYDLTTNTASIIYSSGNSYSGNVRYFYVYDTQLFFTNQHPQTGYEIWATDGLTSPYLVADINPGLASSLPKFYIAYNNSLYFNATNDTSTAEELFRLYRKDVVVEPNSTSTLDRRIACSISPNPIQSSFDLTVNLVSAAAYSFQIIDESGKIFLQEKDILFQQGSSKKSIRIHHMHKGNYFLLLFNANGEQVYTEKITKL